MSYKQRITMHADVSFVLSLFAGFLIGLFAPFELYLSNKYSFFFSGEEMLIFAIPIFVGITVGGTILLQVLSAFNQTLYKYITSILFSILVFLYFQGNFDQTEYGVWDGSKIVWDKYVVQEIIWLIILIICVITVLFMAYKFELTRLKRIIKYVSVCMILLQLFTLSTLLITKGGIKKDPEYLAIEDGENEFSKEENIILLILDSYDGMMLTRIIDEDYSGYYSEILRDFTFYPDTAGAYSYTNLAIPHIITGQKYYNDMTYGDYLNKAYSNSMLLGRLKDNGWRIGIYSEALFPENDAVQDIIDNSRQIKRTVSSHVRLAKYIYGFVGFRYLPQPIKRYFVFYPSDMEAQIGDNEGGYTLFDQTNDHFERVMHESEAVNDIKNFKILHIYGAHPPYHLKDDNTYSETETSEKEVCKANLELADAFLDKLREIGAYDNSTIIICADHGVLQSRQNPLFMIKYKTITKEVKQCFMI